MNLEGLQIVARPRNHWEALDLGLLIARRWYRLLLMSWLCFAVPVFVACWVVMPGNPVLAMVIVWWLKPVYERVPLKILSSAIFGSIPTLKGALGSSRKCVVPGMLGALTLRRFSPSRSFEAPVLVLESLEGEVRRKRLEVLQPKAGSAAFWLTILSVHIEAFLILGLIVGIYFFVPSGFEIDWWGLMVSGSDGGQDWLMNAFMFMAMAVVAPVYVSAGFALYLNRRIELEAWDIELGFKRIAERASKNMRFAPMLVVACIFSSMDTQAVVESEPEMVAESEFISASDEALRDRRVFEAETLSVSRQESRSTIEEILAGSDFHNETTTRIPKFLEDLFDTPEEVPVDEATWLPGFFRFVASVAEMLLWVTVAIGIIWIARRVRLLEKIGVLGSREREPKIQPTEIMGLPVDRNSLPDDVMSSARTTWNSGEHRNAVSLVYRASLSALIHDFHCEFREGDTESDCLRKVPTKPAEVLDLFRKLTRMWLFAAYAHRLPAEEEFAMICDEWSGVFETKFSGNPDRAEAS